MTDRDRALTNRLLTVAQVCERVPLSRDSIYRAIRRGELPAVERCNRLLVMEDELVGWLEAGRVRALRGGVPTEPVPLVSGSRGGLRARRRRAA
jgi:excisionase family DNA binding protein